MWPTPPVAGAVESTGRKRASLPEVDAACRRNPGCRAAGAGRTSRPARPELGARWSPGSHLSTRLPSHGIRWRVTIDPGLPVALAVALLLTLTVTMYLVGRLPSPARRCSPRARAIVQLSVAALVIAAVIGSSGLVAAAAARSCSSIAVVTTSAGSRRQAWPWAAAGDGSRPACRSCASSCCTTRPVPLTGIALIPVVGIVIGQHDDRAHAHRAPHLRGAARGARAVRGGAVARADPSAGDRRGDRTAGCPRASSRACDQVRTVGHRHAAGRLHRRHARWRQRRAGRRRPGARALRDHGDADDHGRGGRAASSAGPAAARRPRPRCVPEPGSPPAGSDRLARQRRRRLDRAVDRAGERSRPALDRGR